MKVFLAHLDSEINTFSPIPTGLANFAEICLVRNGEHGDPPSPKSRGMIRYREMAKERGWEVVESLCASAQPAGRIVQQVYEDFRDEILEDLRRSLPVDAVLLDLHGAMTAIGYDDCEGDLIANVRCIVGVEVPIGVSLDPHSHLTQAMMENATVLTAAKEYPHTDGGRQGRRLFEIIAGAAEGKYKPVISCYDPRMIGIYHTTRAPMRGFVDMLNDMESKPGVLSISFIMGFPWGDVPDMGTKILVVTDNNPELGSALAQEIGEKLFALREAARPHYLTIEEGLDEAMRTRGSPVVLADSSDNPGGGATGDSTFLLRTMLERGISNAAIAMIWDPIAVSMAMDAGVDGELELRIGGKIGPMSGDPVDLHVKVTGLKANAAQYIGPPEARSAIVIGDTAAVHARGIDIVLYSIRHQTFSPDCFTVVGINPLEKHILVVKSSQHFHTTFSPFAAKILYIAGPGSHNPFFENLPYKHFKKDIWPWVENPFERRKMIDHEQTAG